MTLLPITADRFDLDIDLRYATADNFTGRPVYAKAYCWLHEDAVVLLERAIEIAACQDLRLRIFDAFRPQEAQRKLWLHTPDPNFLADPARGSAHSRGVAVDLTLIDRNSRELEMGTAFDEFTPLSYHGSTLVPAPAQRNRHLLLGVMSAAGWDFYAHEWWHYQLFNARARYPLISDSALPYSMMKS
jgi:D-alanyl-D-alanine dipeptidase